jgi:hypothetical protein
VSAPTTAADAPPGNVTRSGANRTRWLVANVAGRAYPALT